MPERRVTLINELGLHARAAAQVVRAAAEYKAKVTLRREDRGIEADARSILDILYLAAGCGKEVLIKADGEDSQAALDAIERLFTEGFGEN
ncbi:MAG TPA: HPr family phosphocarrier protein [Pyrinomonadaceae bacterium]|nr:HPr family phosphocarrier protein [Pyrinomonadaceae bacterium]